MIKVLDLIALFEKMERENWRYKWGADEPGCVDCSGAFKYAFRTLDGYKFTFQSSNWMARQLVVGQLRPAREAQPGWAVFRWREESDNTPERWKDGRGDFYHVGLMGRNGEVLNAASTSKGFIASPLDKGWDYAAPLKRVEYGRIGETEEEEMLYRAKVMTQEDPLNLRQYPKSGNVLAHIPKGAVVDVVKEGDWPRVRYNGSVGYVSGDYLQKVDDGDEQHVNPAQPEYDPMPSQAYTELYNPEKHQYLRIEGGWIVTNGND